MGQARTFYITTPIYYVNDSPHIGHAYTSIACDVMARFKRLDGYDVRFLTGTDDHGQKVEKSAQAANLSPIAFTDQVSKRFRALSSLLNLSNDDFIRTTEPRHVVGVQALWNRLMANGEIYLGKYAGWYSVRDEAFYMEGELVPGPGGTRLAPSGAPVEWVEEPSYFFRLSAWGDRLLAHYANNPDCILPESRRNEVLSFVKGGLQDLSVSRTSFRWGIPVPGDEAHVIYVWLDALANYITALGYPDTSLGGYARYWPAHLHMMGKDILRFHAVYWPAFLMAAGLQPPQRVYAHGWWTVEGQKMSKSLGNAIAPAALVDRYGIDAVRYFVLRELPFGADGDLSHRAIVGRINGDLANDFGNLAQRVLSMINRNCDAKVPVPGALADADRVLLAAAGGLADKLRRAFDVQAFHQALGEIWQVVGQGNRYVDEQAPWALRKTDPARMATVLYVLAELLRHLAILSQPFVPAATGKLLDQLGVAKEMRSFANLDGPDFALPPGGGLPKPEPIFPRFVDAEAGGSPR